MLILIWRPNWIESIRTANRHELTRNLSLPDTLMPPTFVQYPLASSLDNPLTAHRVRWMLPLLWLGEVWHVMTPILSSTLLSTKSQKCPRWKYRSTLNSNTDRKKWETKTATRLALTLYLFHVISYQVEIQRKSVEIIFNLRTRRLRCDSIHPRRCNICWHQFGSTFYSSQHRILYSTQRHVIITRQLSYRKDDRAMPRIYGWPGKFRVSWLCPRLLFPKFVIGVYSDRY